MSTIRLFVALEPDVEACARAVREAEHAFARYPNRIRWEPEENLHVTLKFLGDAPEARMPEFCRALDDVAAGHRPFDYGTGGLGVFPDLGEPRVLWVAVDDLDRRVEDLAMDVESVFAGLGFPRDRRAFTAHLTVARFDAGAPGQGRAAVTRILANPQAADIGRSEQYADRFHLYASRLRQGGGNEYTKLETFTLGANRP